MKKKMKKSVSVLLSIIMILSVFSIIPFASASAATNWNAEDLIYDVDDTLIKAGDTISSYMNYEWDLQFLEGTCFTVYDQENGYDIIERTDYWVADRDYIFRWGYTVYYDGGENVLPGYEDWDYFVECFVFHVEPYDGSSDPDPGSGSGSLTPSDVEQLLYSMSATIDSYFAQGDYDNAGPLIDYYNPLAQAYDQSSHQVTASVESAYNAALAYFLQHGGTISGGGQGGAFSFNGNYPDANNVYVNNDFHPMDVYISNLSVGDVIVASTGIMEVRKGNCTVVLVGGTFGDVDTLAGEVNYTYPNNVTLSDSVDFDFNEDARIIDMGNNVFVSAVYNNSIGNSFMVVGKEGNTVYLAGYYCTVYTISWKDWNGNYLSAYDYQQSLVVDGAVPSYPYGVYRNSTAQYDYTFIGWKDSSDNFYSQDEALPAASKDETYYAQYSSTVRSYTVTWKDGNNNTLKSETLNYGATPSYTGDVPTKAADAGYTYEFNGTWTPSITSVTGKITYTAQFTAVPKNYTVTWVDGDGNTLKQEQLAYGTTPSYDTDVDGIPTKESDVEYTYSFAGVWSPEVVAVTGDATYTAQFNATNRFYTITWKNEDGTVIDTTEAMYGANPFCSDPEKAEDDQYTYEFAGWTPELTAVTGDAEYTATFTAIPKPIDEPVIKNGPNANGCFYVNDVRLTAYQLAEYEGDWYFIAENHRFVVDQHRYLSATVVKGTPFSAGYYDFDEFGRMIIKDGVIENDFYYVNGVKQKAYQLFDLDGEYYFIAENHKIAKNAHRYLSAAVVEGTPFVAGYYDFDAEGKMIIKNGADADGYFYINGVKQKAYKLISYGDDYYFVAENHKYVKSQRRYLNASMVAGTNFTVGYYNFDEYGKMILN